MRGKGTAMLDHNRACEMAQAWIRAWNDGDLEAFLAHYAEDVQLTSPLVVTRMGEASGTLSGKDGVRQYIRVGLETPNRPRFELLDVLSGVGGYTIYYRRDSGITTADTMILNGEEKAVRVYAHYGAQPT